ncbi:MAG TPA: hypothetical protein VFT05_14385 [Burkholderiaceae bacterium]|nr:hypothetical protein [Burkholderiaceae bacterium]
METLLSASGLPPCERIRFASLCRRQGLRPERFLVMVDALGLPGCGGGRRTVRVWHAHGCRRYPLDALGRWLEAFEADLRSGHFHFWYGPDRA